LISATFPSSWCDLGELPSWIFLGGFWGDVPFVVSLAASSHSLSSTLLLQIWYVFIAFCWLWSFRKEAIGAEDLASVDRSATRCIIVELESPLGLCTLKPKHDLLPCGLSRPPIYSHVDWVSCLVLSAIWHCKQLRQAWSDGLRWPYQLFSPFKELKEFKIK
jgi:hypothetical protein